MSLPGKVIALDTSDANEDGIPGYADGYHLDGLPDDLTNDSNFVKMTVTLPGGFDPVNGQIELSYMPPIRRRVSVTGDGSNDSPFEYQLPSDGGALRIWSNRTTNLGFSNFITRTAEPFGDRDPNDPNNGGLGYYSRREPTT